MSNKIKILIGDNSEEFSTIFSDQLIKAEFDITMIPKDGQLILDTIIATSPNFVIIDVFMTKLDAIEILKAITLQSQITPKILVLSNVDDPFIERELMQNGAVYYMLRPFQYSELINCIKKINSNSLNTKR